MRSYLLATPCLRDHRACRIPTKRICLRGGALQVAVREAHGLFANPSTPPRSLADRPSGESRGLQLVRVGPPASRQRRQTSGLAVATLPLPWPPPRAAAPPATPADGASR